MAEVEAAVAVEEAAVNSAETARVPKNQDSVVGTSADRGALPSLLQTTAAGMGKRPSAVWSGVYEMSSVGSY